MIPQQFPQNSAAITNYKDFYQNQGSNPNNINNPSPQMNHLLMSQNPNSFQINPANQLITNKMPGNNQTTVISSNFVPNKEYQSHKSMNISKPMNPMQGMKGSFQKQTHQHQNFHQHKMDHLAQRSTKIMKPSNQLPHKMDIFKQSNYNRRNHHNISHGQPESLSDYDEAPQMKYGNRFMRPPFIPKQMPVKRPKYVNMNMDMMPNKPMKQQFFFPEYPVNNNMNNIESYMDERVMVQDFDANIVEDGAEEYGYDMYGNSTGMKNFQKKSI